MKFLNKIDSAEQLIQDENNRLVTDVEKAKWDTVTGKETPSGAQTKATKALTDSKAYVDGKVKTDVPEGAKFTDTITTINGKTGTIAKADIVALGIPAQDTVYTHPTTHSISEVSGLQNALDGKVDDSQVLTNVPLNAKFTDTVYSHPESHPASMITESSTKRFVSDAEKANWNNKWDYNESTVKAVKVNSAGNADTVNGKTVAENIPAGAVFTDTVTTINGKTGAISKDDIVALGIPAQDTNTTYSEITTAEIDTGTASTLRTITGRRVKYILDKAQGWIDGLTKSDVGLGNVDNTSDASKPISTATQTALNAKANSADLTTHTSSTSNPHSVTKAQVGLGSVDNTSDASKPISTATQTALNAKANATDLTTHTGSTSNPHSVTKAQVGLGNVDNVKQMPISGGVLENYREKLTTVSASGGSINLSLGNVFVHTPSGNRTYSITNAVNGQAHSFTLIINMGGTVRTLTFPGSVKWPGGEIPDMTTANTTYVLTFLTINGGGNWLGMFGGEFVSGHVSGGTND